MQSTVRGGRTALAITMLLIVTLTVPLIFWGDAASQAQQGQPTPSGTGPAIQLLNPSDYTAVPMMSDKDTNDADSAPEYHFTAVVTNIPPNPLVEFFIVQGDDVTFIGNGTFRDNGAVDVTAPIPDDVSEGIVASDPTLTERGEVVVRAILFANNGQNEVARDDQDAVVNQKDRQSGVGGEAPSPTADPDQDPSKAAETVEIVYPLHGGDFGFYRPGGTGPGVGVIDVEWSNGTDRIVPYYTVSPTDVDPVWKNCSPATGTNDTQGEQTAASTSSTTESSAADGVRCTLQDSDLPGNVTGVAAVAMDTEGPPTGLRPNSGDAHRVIGYSQQVGIVSVEGQTLPATAINGCTDYLSAQVFDDNEPPRPIAGVNVDVHAQGPDDNLAFNTDPDEQDDFDQGQSDDSNPPQNHPTETGRDCSDNTRDANGLQGVHAVGGGFGDRKHIESTRQTDDDGNFVFRLWSSSEGSTRITAWADTTDDDRFCFPEKGGDSLVIWGARSADPAPETAQQSCPSPTPSGSASSGSPTSPSGSSPSTSASASGSPSATTPSSSPSRTSSPSGSAPSATGTSPSGTSSTGTTGGGTTGGGTSPQQAEREVTLEASQSRKTFGKTFTLSGSVTSSNAACTASVPVRILRDVLGGASEFEVVAQEQTDTNGAYSLNLTADKGANYVAEVQETSSCAEATSSPQPVLVRVKVSLRVSDSTVRRGQRVRLTAKTAPCPATARDRVLLFRSIDGQFGKSGGKSSNARCTATFRRKVGESAVFQARWPKQSPEYLSGRSRSKAVRVTR